MGTKSNVCDNLPTSDSYLNIKAICDLIWKLISINPIDAAHKLNDKLFIRNLTSKNY